DSHPYHHTVHAGHGLPVAAHMKIREYSHDRRSYHKQQECCRGGRAAETFEQAAIAENAEAYEDSRRSDSIIRELGFYFDMRFPCKERKYVVFHPVRITPSGISQLSFPAFLEPSLRELPLYRIQALLVAYELERAVPGVHVLYARSALLRHPGNDLLARGARHSRETKTVFLFSIRD